jgi:PAS domain S-box-containing protein
VISRAIPATDPHVPSARIGIGTKIALLLSAIAVLASATVGIITYNQFSQALVDQELKQLSSLADIKAVKFAAEMETLRTDALFASRSPVMQRLVRALQAGGTDPVSGETAPQLRQRATLFCTELLRAKPAYSQVRLIGIADGGRELVRVQRQHADALPHVVPLTDLQRKGQEPYFAAAMKLPEGSVYFSDINLNREHGKVAEPPMPVMRAATPILGQDGQPLAILVINSLFQTLVDGLHRGLSKDHVLLVTNDRGDYLIHPDEEKTFGFDRGRRVRIQNDFVSLTSLIASPAHSPLSIVDKSSDDQPMAIGICRVPIDPADSNRFVEIAVAAPYQVAIPVSATARNRCLLAGALVALIALGWGYLLSRSMTKPLRQIAAAAEAFGRGEKDLELPTGSRDEIGVVARALASMMSDVRSAQAGLNQRAEQLAQSRRSALNMLQDVESSRANTVKAEQISREHSARTQAILDGASDAIITINIEGTVESFNNAAVRIFGYSAAEVIGRNVKMLMPAPYHDEHDGYLHNYLTSGISKIIGIGREVLGLRKDGNTFPMHLAVSDVKLGERRLFTGIVRDITDLRNAMQQLSAANEELARRSQQIERFNVDLRRSNEELKQFAYVASHDLQEPLRKVTAFCQMLRDDYADQLDDNARTYIQYAVDGALRMKTLVQDLLTYSRVETQGKALEPTDAHDACAEAIDNLTVAIEEAAAEIVCDPLPVVSADRAQLVRLFQNLIGNAIKYRGDKPPRVHVSATESDDRWEFRVTDNGIGIDPQYHERIFVIFQRLHGRDEYTGTGIGLAVCKRIVERAGGRIWVESRSGAGCEFCFTLFKSTEEPTGITAGVAHERYRDRVKAAIN